MRDLTPEQRQAVTHPGSVVVRAGAGSGKTRVLAERAVWLLEGGLRPRELVAVTFTEAAALELRERIARTLEARGVWGEAVRSQLGEARIGTLHSLCATVLREHPVESGVGPGFGIEDAETAGGGPALDHALLRALEGEALPAWCSADTLRAWLAALLTDEHSADAAFVIQRRGGLAAQWEGLEAGLKGLGAVRAQLEALFGVLDASGATDPLDPLERARLAALEVYAQFGLSRGGGAGFGERFDLLEWRRQIGEALGTLRSNAGRAGAWPQGKAPTLTALLALRELGDAEADLLAHGREVLEVLPLLERVYGRVSRTLRAGRVAAGTLGFDDLERLALGALSQPQVRAYYHTRLRAVLLDEAQDTSPIQAEIVQLLIGPRTTLTAVGDAQQSIYGFRRAAPALFARLGEALGEVQLTGSFRAHPALIERLNAYFMRRLSPEAVPFVPQQAQRSAAGQHSALEWQVFERATLAEAREAEAQHLAGRIRALQREGHALSEMAVLLRARGDLAVYTGALRAAGLAYTLRGSAAPLERPEIADALALLRVLADLRDDLALVTVLRSPFAGFSDADLHRLALGRGRGEALSAALERSPQRPGWLYGLLERRATLPPARALQEALERSGYLDALAFLPEGERSAAHLHALIGWLRGQQGVLPTAWDSVRRLEQSGLPALGEALPEGEQAVTVSTVHGAKGLEYPVVFVPDLTRTPPRDTLALRFEATRGVAVRGTGRTRSALYTRLEDEARQREQLERQRLEYVAFTRARDRLLLSAAVSPRSRWSAERVQDCLSGEPEERSGLERTLVVPSEVTP